MCIRDSEPYRELAYDGAEVPWLPDCCKNTIVGYSWSKSLSPVSYTHLVSSYALASACFSVRSTSSLCCRPASVRHISFSLL